VIKGVAIVKTRMNKGCSNSGGSVKVKSASDAAEITDMVVTGAR
jgi:hypothetical protein